MTRQEFLDLAQNENFLDWDWLSEIDYILETDVFNRWYIRTKDSMDEVLYDTIRYWDRPWEE